jgi:ATPase family associated with various cellular activities (AAA)
MDRSSCRSVATTTGRAPDAVPESRTGSESSSRTACHVELVEDIPTGHALPLTLEVSTIIDPPEDPDPDRVPGGAPLAFGAPLARSEVAEPGRGEPFADAAEHLTALLELIAARAALAIAERWHGDPRSAGIDHVLAHEISALGAATAAQLASARVRLAARGDAVTARTIASLGAGLELPLVELSRELGLSDLAAQLLVAALAPRARREIGRLYRILANDVGRPTDDGLLAALLAGDDPRLRDQLCGELAEAGALIRHGLVVRDAHGGLDVDEALLARLRGQPAPRSPASVLRAADRALDELVIDRQTLRALMLELASPRDPDQPVRVVIRGRRGSGRHATIAALAARVDRRIACIDAGQLPHGPTRAAALRRELARAVIARAIPVISGLEVRGGADPETAMWIAQVLDRHPGPVVVRTAQHAAVPLAPGYLDVALAPLTEAARRRAFAVELERHALAADAARLATRHWIGPGTIARAAATARRRLDRGSEDPTAMVDAVIHEHAVARLGQAATRVTRLATWAQIAVPAELRDRLHELIGRARHGRAVFEDWGAELQLATARGLSALFHGPRGTGKTLAARLIARELDRALYRVALAPLISTGPGEAERQLGELFEAAEDGGLILLFDDAEALLASPAAGALRRRLATFEGTAIFTAQRDAAIDPAFQRQLSMRLAFPFPDEALRAQLWAAHLPRRLPTAGPLDLAALARQFRLSGGAIRDSVLRAAYLAAQDGSALSQAHLERAVQLEGHALGERADDDRRG